MGRSSTVATGLMALIVAGVFYFSIMEKWENIPTFLVSCIALSFSYYAYLFSKEKFRLDLFEKRWEVYIATLEFCSLVMKYGQIPKHSEDKTRNKEVLDALVAAQNSFRGVGYHKMRSLFGEDIYNLMEELNSAYSWLYSHSRKNTYTDEESEIEDNHIRFIWETVKNLPELFRPYVYFGDYKNNDVIGRQVVQCVHKDNLK